MVNYLTKRGERYAIRRKVPLDLQTYFRRKEIIKALGTSDPMEARRRCNLESVKIDELFSSARAHIVSQAGAPSTTQVEPRYESAVDPLGRFDAAVLADLGSTVSDSAVRETQFRASLKVVMREVLHELFAEIGLGTLTIGAAHDKATGPATVRHRASKNRRRDSNQSSASGPPIHLAALVQKWAKERKPQIRTVEIANRVILRFYQHIGRFPISAITRRHVVEFKDRLLESGQTPVNTDAQLTILGTLLNYAADNLLAEPNIAKGIKVGERKNAKAVRVPFDVPALNAIFSSPVYSEGARPQGCGGDAAYWMPLLALFTGARLEEMAQLRPEDIYEDTYQDVEGNDKTVWVIRITNEGDGQGVKNAGSVRRFPVHAELRKRGFLEYVKARAGKARIFDQLKKNSYGDEGALFGNWFGKYLREACKVTDKRMVFHSFRHGFKDTAREAGIPEDVADAITGHSSGNVARRYGAIYYPLRPLVEAIDKYRVAGLLLPD